ncbi:hypothetical protein AYL99_01794 [Fonsecaea erecta]|uniref:FAD dependent oxidoreductase domain-containing protein n=1 Tax=Fonsecaea erecta TaxID=1367422 RepID=A0A178ZRY4_9EURO|nr:hypothetical protein AYL99_01794 [Fonsecaea erecta]OAP62567.1 hypothetical protein AYL99_01794 [Fonsecaea erecta]
MTNHLLLPVAGPMQSYWQQEGQKYHDAVGDNIVDLPSSCEVAIVGGGYSGIATAYHLLHLDHPPASVVLLEAREPCSGATGRNGGNLRPDLFLGPARLCKRFEPSAAFEIMQFETDHLSMIKDLIFEEVIDCDFCETTSLLVLTTLDQVAAAREMYDTLKQAPQFDKTVSNDLTFYVGDDAPRRTGMAEAKGYVAMPAAHLSPYKLLMALLRRCMDKGLALKSHTPVLSVRSAGHEGHILTTETGATTTAHKVIYATNAYTSALLPEYSNAIIPCKGLACRIAGPEGKMLPGLPTSSILSMEQDPASDATGYNYMIQLADNTIVVGGAHHTYKKGEPESWYNNADDSHTIEEAQRYFEADFMQRAFIGWETTYAQVNQVWTGIMGYSADSLPHIGSIPNRPGSFVLAGFNGHGMPVIFKAAKELAAMVKQGLEYEQTALPALYKTTGERLASTRNDILGGRGLKVRGT